MMLFICSFFFGEGGRGGGLKGREEVLLKEERRELLKGRMGFSRLEGRWQHVLSDCSRRLETKVLGSVCGIRLVTAGAAWPSLEVPLALGLRRDRVACCFPPAPLVCLFVCLLIRQAFNTLRDCFPEEYTVFGLAQLVPAMAAPVIKRSLAGWSPLKVTVVLIADERGKAEGGRGKGEEGRGNGVFHVIEQRKSVRGGGRRGSHVIEPSQAVRGESFH